jgi:hypothetical protein
MATTVFAFSGNKIIRNPFALTLQSGEAIP